MKGIIVCERCGRKFLATQKRRFCSAGCRSEETRFWVAACKRLLDGWHRGNLVLEMQGSELRFRYRETPTNGYVLKRWDTNSSYAAIVERKDWPGGVPMPLTGSK